MLKYAAYSFRSSAIAAFHNTSEAVNVQINGYTFARGEREFPFNPGNRSL